MGLCSYLTTDDRLSPPPSIDWRLRRLDRTLDAEVRQPVQPARQVPVAVAQQRHRRRHQDRADDRRVEQHGDAEAEAHLLQEDQTGRRANPPKTATMINAAPVMIFAVACRPTATDSRLLLRLVVVLPDPAEQEDVVVHAEAEQHREEEERQPGLDRSTCWKPKKSGTVALLEDEHEQP